MCFSSIPTCPRACRQPKGTQSEVERHKENQHCEHATAAADDDRGHAWSVKKFEEDAASSSSSSSFASSATPPSERTLASPPPSEPSSPLPRASSSPPPPSCPQRRDGQGRRGRRHPHHRRRLPEQEGRATAHLSPGIAAPPSPSTSNSGSFKAAGRDPALAWVHLACHHLRGTVVSGSGSAPCGRSDTRVATTSAGAAPCVQRDLHGNPWRHLEFHKRQHSCGYA